MKRFLPGFLYVLAVLLALWGFRGLSSVTRLRTLSEVESGASRLWSDGNRRLVSLFESGSRVDVVVRDPVSLRQIGRETFDLASLLRDGSQEMVRMTKEGEGNRIPYAVSRSGQRFAFYDGQAILVVVRQRGQSERRYRTLPAKQLNVFDLAFLGEDSVVVVYDTGELRILDYKKQMFREAGTIVGLPCAIFPIKDNSFGVASFGEGDLVVIDVGSEQMRMKLVSLPFQDGLSLDVASNGDIAIGTASGYVAIVAKGLSENKFVPLVHGKGVSSVAFLGDSILAVGDFEGVYRVAVNRNHSIEELRIDGSFRAIEVIGEDVALAGERLVSVEVKRSLRITALAVIAMLLCLLSIGGAWYLQRRLG